MEIMAEISDDLVNDVVENSHSSTITEALTTVLQDWLDVYKIKALNAQIVKDPIIINGVEKIRMLNRKI
jgi:hypothetical protein